MASWSYSDITGLTTPAGTISLNAASGDTLFVDPGASSGLGVNELRTSIFDKGQTDGYNILPTFEGGQHIVLAGVVLIRSAGTDAAIVTARNTILTNTRTMLRSIKSVDGSLTFGAGDVILVRVEQLIGATGALLKNFVFGLVSASPA